MQKLGRLTLTIASQVHHPHCSLATKAFRISTVEDMQKDCFESRSGPLFYLSFYVNVFFQKILNS